MLQSCSKHSNITQAIADHCVSSLYKFHWALVDNFMGTDHGRLILKECRSMYEKGLFTDGRLLDETVNKQSCANLFLGECRPVMHSLRNLYDPTRSVGLITKMKKQKK